jgi:predicted ATPase
MRFLEAALDSLRAAGLVRPAGGEDRADYTFRQSLVQDTAYRSILRRQRREFHRRVGEALRSAGYWPLELDHA